MRLIIRTVMWSGLFSIIGSLRTGQWIDLSGALPAMSSVVANAAAGLSWCLGVLSGLYGWNHAAFWTFLSLAVLAWLALNAHRLTFGADRDPKRLFTSEERYQAASRAAGRCEHKHPLLPRCHGPAAQGDHVFPWSKGGATTLGNLQSLCAHHNRRKSNHIPSRAYIWRLERRRRKYFPPDVPAGINWISRG